MRILSIDGGGVRVAAAVAFLAEFEQALPECESILSFFDVFAGTSAGALVIAALVYGKMTAKEIRDSMFSEETLQKIMPFSIRGKILGIMQLKPKYDGEGKREVIEKHIPEGVKLSDTNKRVIIAWTDIENDQAELAVSWKSSGDVSVRDIVDASSAAPGYFPFIEFKQGAEEKKKRGVDGGVFANDPCDLAVLETLEDFDPPFRVLSLGTGEVKHNLDGHAITNKNAGGIQWLLSGSLVNLVFDTPREAVQYRMEQLTELFPIRYCRIQGKVLDSSLDNTSAHNIKSLKERGKNWWQENEDKVRKLIFYNSIITKRTTRLQKQMTAHEDIKSLFAYIEELETKAPEPACKEALEEIKKRLVSVLKSCPEFKKCPVSKEE